MVSVTLSVPNNLKKEMDGFNEINWSAVARDAIKKKIVMLKKFQRFTKESIMTEKDAIMLGRSVNKGLAKKYKKLR